jgi:hypothetical protein
MTISFSEAIEQSDTVRSLLIGNGFSIAQAGAQFSYASLLDRAGLEPDNPVRKVFTTLNTFDFEQVMQALQHAAQIEDAYEEADKAALFRNDAIAVREALIHAFRKVHPGISFDIPQEQREQCGKFLQNFENIFTLNYDLLLYWVILKMGGYAFTDGFGLGETEGGFRTFSPLAKCNTHYLHGALHLFLGPKRETLKRIVTRSTIINDITNTIRARDQLPLFVSEGSSVQKMARINSVPYLRWAYDKLKDLKGSVFVYGHSIAENDFHLYNALFSSEIDKLFVCVHCPNENLQGIRERLAPFLLRNDEIDVLYIDSATVNVWH